MSLDYASDLERKFFADNLLLNEDWDNEDRFPDDLSQFLDVESNMHVDDLMKGLSDDLEIPMLDHADGLDLTAATFVEPWKDFSDGSDSGLDCGNAQIGIKDEPLSPASSHGSDTTDSLSSQIGLQSPQNLTFQPLMLPPEVKLESPPLTPPREQDTYFTPVTTLGQTSQVTAPITQTLPNISVQQAAKLPISRVANNKVNIQPKPTTLIQPKSSLQNTGVAKPLVLTPEEFAKLTAQGVLKFNPPAKQPSNTLSNNVINPTTAAATLPLTPSAVQQKSTAIQALSFKSTISPQNPDVDIKNMKRQQRMIKNRESACLSRKRKKEYMSSLEQKLHEYTVENDKLKQENTNLKKKITILQSENEKLKTIAPLGQAKKVTCVLAVMLLLSLNLGSFTGILLGSNETAQQIPIDAVRHGRTLMSASEENVKEQQFEFTRQPDFDKAQSTLDRLRKSMEIWSTPDSGNSTRDLVLFNKDSMCPTYFNTTESLRLMNELTGWVLGHKAEQKQAQEQHKQQQILQQQQEQKQQKDKRKKFNKRSPAYRNADTPPAEAHLQQYRNDRGSPYEVQVFGGPERYAEFFDAINRRNDTFYVVSFRRDHLLLPATTHNKTTRPRMSLVMPAVSLNDSMQPEPGNIAMMQIDCEVMATKLVEISKATIPHYAAENLTILDPPVVSPQTNKSRGYRKKGAH